MGDKQLSEIERVFIDMKHFIDIRPERPYLTASKPMCRSVG